jgi:predicted phosphodiesterase
VRYAILSDIHANLEALGAVIGRMRPLAVDRIVSLGDVVGYYADPGACLELLRRSGAHSIAGNHDRAATGAKDPVDFGETARRAVLWTRGVLGAEDRAFLDALPVWDHVDDFLIVHAALHPEPNEDLHLSTRARVEHSLDVLASGRFGKRLCFFGHTHRPVIHELRDGRYTLRSKPDILELSPDAAYLVNPGSVGQPRDGDQRASFVVYDSRAGTLAFHRVEYDRARCLQKAQAVGLLHGEPRLTLAYRALRVRAARGMWYARRALGA